MLLGWWVYVSLHQTVQKSTLAVLPGASRPGLSRWVAALHCLINRCGVGPLSMKLFFAYSQWFTNTSTTNRDNYRCMCQMKMPQQCRVIKNTILYLLYLPTNKMLMTCICYHNVYAWSGREAQQVSGLFLPVNLCLYFVSEHWFYRIN